MNCRVFAVLLGLACCSISLRTFSAAIDQDTAKKLVKGATETFLAFRKDGVGKTGTSVIPKKFWAASICDLKPVKVYLHMNNIVVAQAIADGKEEGVYIYEPFSSYLPMDGVDGFVLTPKPNARGTYALGTGVFSYERKTKNQEGNRTSFQIPVQVRLGETGSPLGPIRIRSGQLISLPLCCPPVELRDAKGKRVRELKDTREPQPLVAETGTYSIVGHDPAAGECVLRLEVTKK